MSKVSRIALIIAIIVIIVEIPWLARTPLAFVITGLAVAVGLNSIAIIKNQKRN